MTAYDPNNLRQILRGEFPCFQVYEDEHVLAFLDIMPRAPGHTLVIPKAPARTSSTSSRGTISTSRAPPTRSGAAKKAFQCQRRHDPAINEPAGGTGGVPTCISI